MSQSSCDYAMLWEVKAEVCQDKVTNAKTKDKFNKYQKEHLNLVDAIRSARLPARTVVECEQCRCSILVGLDYIV